MPMTALGRSDLQVSRLALGSWRTYERISRDQGVRHVYASEDRDDLTKILGQQYHVVVGNPPYITPKDPGLNQAYRERYATCHMKYALVVPFVDGFLIWRSPVITALVTSV